MAIWRVDNSTQYGGKACAPWVPNTAYSLGARVVCRYAYGTTARRKWVYECTTAGTSHGTTEPTWPDSGTVNDNDIVWTCRSPDDGTWENASCVLGYITNHAMADGDTCLVCSAHSEAYINAAFSITTSVTAASPNKIIAVDKDTLAKEAGALVAGAGSSCEWTFSPGYLYCYGVHFKTYANGYPINLATDGTRNSHFIFESDGSMVFTPFWTEGLRIYGGGDYLTIVELLNATVDLSNKSGMAIYGSTYPGSTLIWRGGSALVHASTTALFKINATGLQAILEGVDLSGLPAGCYLQTMHGTAGNYHGWNGKVELRGCKLPSSFAGMYNAALQPRFRYWPERANIVEASGYSNDMLNFLSENAQGTATIEKTIIRTGGANNGTAGFSMKMVSSAGCIPFLAALISPRINGFTTSTSSTTFTIEGIWDSEDNLTNEEIWMELLYPKNNSDPLLGIARSRVEPNGTPADLSASAEEWADGSMTNPNPFKISVTVTPGKAGPIAARIFLAKASATVYIDPKITES